MMYESVRVGMDGNRQEETFSRATECVKRRRRRGGSGSGGGFTPNHYLTAAHFPIMLFPFLSTIFCLFRAFFLIFPFFPVPISH